MLVQIQRFLRPLFFLIAAVSILSACQKDIDQTTTTNPEIPELPDLTTLVRSSASGFVTDENNSPVENASVKLGTGTTTTDADGFFEISDVDVVKNAAVVTVEKNGYFKGIKTYIASGNNSGFFRIRLIPKTISGTVAGDAGGTVALANGLSVRFPSNAVVNAASGAAYTGTVNVSSYWIDPTSVRLAEEMPGDLRGLLTSGEMQFLTTYGMAAVELTGAGGELLQVASGKTATLTMPVPAAINGTAPASIPLWSFDENKGLWKQEGSATKTGNTYVGEVSHFSFWNCDVPANYVLFDCRVVDATGAVVPFVSVKISVVGNPNNSAWGWTDQSGYVAGAIPANASLLLEVFSNFNCGNSIYSQNFSSGSTNISLGNITISNTTTTANVSGTVTDCAGLPVTNGYITLTNAGVYYRHYVVNGVFNFNVALCNGPAAVSIIAEDGIALQQSSVMNVTLNAGANAVGNLQACGVTTAQFIEYSVDGGTSQMLSSPADTLFHTGNGTTGAWYIGGTNNNNTYANFSMNINLIAVGSLQTMETFMANGVPQGAVVVTPNNAVSISELGPVGGFIAGTFNATLMTTAPMQTYTVTGAFRVRRSF